MQVKMYFTNRLIFRKFLKDGSRELQEERLRILGGLGSPTFW